MPFAAILRQNPEIKEKELDCDQDVELFDSLLAWLYSTTVIMSEDVFKVAELFFMAYDFQVLDLMSRCEHEIINRINPSNVTDLLVLLFPCQKRDSKHAQIIEDQELAQIQSLVLQKYEQSIHSIVCEAKTFFLQEFQDILVESGTDVKLEQKLASVPGLIISLFTHITERTRKKRNKMGRVTFSNVDEVNNDSMTSLFGSDGSHRF